MRASKHVSTILKAEDELVVPASVRRRAGIKSGDRVVFSVAPRSITITASPEKTYKPTKAEIAAIKKGEAEIARGEFVTLAEFLDNDVDRSRRKGRAKAERKVSR